MSLAALETYLKPLKSLFDEEGISEISINRPQEAWIEKRGDMERRELPEMDLEHLKSLARLIAQATDQRVSEETPLLSATLPEEGFRVQVVMPPACENGTIGFSIRKQTIMNLDLEGYEALGAFQSTVVRQADDENNKKLRALLDSGAIREFLTQAVLMKKNIVISGGTSTGKTTFMNAVLKKIPDTERIITCEDAREIIVDHIPNRMHLLASRGGQGRSTVSTQDLIEACLRLRPDRIMVGELRGKEAFSFLRAVNTGHPGSITTVHADTPALAYEQLILMVMQAGLGITRDQIKDYVENVINIVVQLKRGDKGKRFVSEIAFVE